MLLKDIDYYHRILVMTQKKNTSMINNNLFGVLNKNRTHKDKEQEETIKPLVCFHLHRRKSFRDESIFTEIFSSPFKSFNCDYYIWFFQDNFKFINFLINTS